MKHFTGRSLNCLKNSGAGSYDAFTAKNGLINNRANGQAFSDDSSYYLLCSLENVDEDGNLKSKADMFTKRTIKPERRVTSVDTPSEALAISIGERGKVDLPFMAQLLGTPGDYGAIQTELRGVIFKDPMAPDDVESGWQTADEYLSGDVRSKLRIAHMAANRDSAFNINVEALQKAQPKDLEASEIDVRLGATWIDPGYIQQFMEETFETPYYLRRSIEVKFSEMNAEWRINGKSSPSYNDVAAYVTYGTDRANAYRILEETLNLKDIRRGGFPGYTPRRAAGWHTGHHSVSCRPDRFPGRGASSGALRCRLYLIAELFHTGSHPSP